MKKLLTVLLVALAILTSKNTQASYKKSILGSWELKKFTITTLEGHETPWCQGASGLLTYEARGYMSVSINCNPNSSSKLPAHEYNGMLFYAGKFVVKNSDVFHFILNSSSQNLIGKKLVRRIETLNKGWLILTGKIGDSVLRIEWVRL